MLKPKIKRAGRRKNEWRLVLYSRNGEPIVWSETYERKAKAKKALLLLATIDYAALEIEP